MVAPGDLCCQLHILLGRQQLLSVARVALKDAAFIRREPKGVVEHCCRNLQFANIVQGRRVGDSIAEMATKPGRTRQRAGQLANAFAMNPCLRVMAAQSFQPGIDIIGRHVRRRSGHGPRMSLSLATLSSLQFQKAQPPRGIPLSS